MGMHTMHELSQTFFPYQLAIVAEAFSRNLIEVYGREFGLSREEWRLLFLLADEDKVNSLELGRRTTLDKVQVTRASQRLEEKALITRQIDDNDRRLRIYQCAKKGRALFAKVLPQVEDRTRKILDEMPPADLNALIQGLTGLQSAMSRVQTNSNSKGLRHAATTWGQNGSSCLLRVVIVRFRPRPRQRIIVQHAV